MAELGGLGVTYRPKLLFICHILPYPPDEGAKIRSYNILRQLARAFDITALCFYRIKSGVTVAQVPERVALLREFADLTAFPIPQEHNRPRFVWDHLRSSTSHRVYTDYVFASRQFRSHLTEVLRSESFDLAHVTNVLSSYLPLLRRIPVALSHDNFEPGLLCRRAEAERAPYRRAYVAYQARLTENMLRHWCDEVAVNVVVSEKDRADLQRLAPRARFAIAPNGVDIERFSPLPSANRGIVFVGGTNWSPNYEALTHFCENILPLIQRSGTPVPVRWVGHASVKLQRACRQRYGVDLTGYVDDIRPYVRDAACYVVPLRVGGGSRLKILDAWAMGKAVVSTSIGCEGLSAVDGENILIRDTPEEFAAAVRSVLRDEDLRCRLGEHGRETVVQYYSWDIVGSKLVNEYLELIDRSRKHAELSAARHAQRGGDS